jgi:hypothetical protein
MPTPWAVRLVGDPSPGLRGPSALGAPQKKGSNRGTEQAVPPWESPMHYVPSHRLERTTHHSPRPSINPYFMEVTGLTIGDIQRARATTFDSTPVAI